MSSPYTAISVLEPRFVNPNMLLPMNSSQKRMQREHSMHLSLSKIILPATSTFLGFTFLLSM